MLAFQTRWSQNIRLATVMFLASRRVIESRNVGVCPLTQAWVAALIVKPSPTFHAQWACRCLLATKRPLRPQDSLWFVARIQDWERGAALKTLESSSWGLWTIRHTFFISKAWLKQARLRIPRPPEPLGCCKIFFLFQWIPLCSMLRQKKRINRASNLWRIDAGIWKIASWFIIEATRMELMMMSFAGWDSALWFQVASLADTLSKRGLKCRVLESWISIGEPRYVPSEGLSSKWRRCL